MMPLAFSGRLSDVCSLAGSSPSSDAPTFSAEKEPGGGAGNSSARPSVVDPHNARRTAPSKPGHFLIHVLMCPPFTFVLLRIRRGSGVGTPSDLGDGQPNPVGIFSS